MLHVLQLQAPLCLHHVCVKGKRTLELFLQGTQKSESKNDESILESREGGGTPCPAALQRVLRPGDVFSRMLGSHGSVRVVSGLNQRQKAAEGQGPCSPVLSLPLASCRILGFSHRKQKGF